MRQGVLLATLLLPRSSYAFQPSPPSRFLKTQQRIFLQAPFFTLRDNMSSGNNGNREVSNEHEAKKPRLGNLTDDDIVLSKKKALRKEIRARIKDELNSEIIKTQSAKVWEKIFELPVYKSSKSIGLFLSMPSGEINTDVILIDAIKKGKEIYVPQVGKNFEKCDMELLKVVLDKKEAKDDDEIFHKKWPKNKWKIPEPPEDMPITIAKPGDIDLLIVPGLGFDRTRSRIGQGKGYYDRFIARMISDETPLPLVAVALQPQLVETSIPVADYDRKMDMVVLPDEIIE